MSKQNTAAAVTLPPPVDYDTLLSNFSAKERQTFERQLAARDTKSIPGLGDLWRRLACQLTALAPGFAKLVGVDSYQFFIPDGKYRKQVYALHALPDGSLAVIIPDILDDAVKAKIVGKTTERPALGAATPSTPGSGVNGATYAILGTHETMNIESLDGKTPNPAAFYKDMTGWNRKAIQVTLPPGATETQIRTAEKLCAIAAKGWEAALKAAAANPPAAAAGGAKRGATA